jgi:copper resistance protein C
MRAPAALRAVALTLLCGLALLLGAGQALAHTRLIGSDPADGARLASAPGRISLTFNENMQAEFTTVTVVGPDGAMWSTGPVGVDGPTVGIDLRPLGPAGAYQVGYRVVSDDGHPVTGAITFTLTAPGPGAEVSPPPVASAAPPPVAAVTAAPADPGGGPPVWPWIVGAVLLVGGGVVAALRLGR